MELPAAATRRVPPELGEEYRAMTDLDREDLMLATYTLVQQGKSDDRIAAKLEEAGYSPEFALWYLTETRAAGGMVRLYSDRVGGWDEPRRAEVNLTERLRSQAWMWGVPMLICDGITTYFGLNPPPEGKPDWSGPLLLIAIAGKVSQLGLAYTLARLKGQREVFMAALTLCLGWFVILYLLIKRAPKERSDTAAKLPPM
ncbi:MAG: hypothetical protein ACO1SV_06905 [Fimbriimonas sp.]